VASALTEEILARIRREIAKEAQGGGSEPAAVDAESLPAIASRAELEYLNRNYALFDPASPMRSHRRVFGPIVLAFKRRFRNLVLGVLDRYFEKERLLLLELVRFQNALAERSDRVLREVTERTKAVAERNDLFLGALDLRLEAVEAQTQMRRALTGASDPGDGDGEDIVAEMAEAFAGAIGERVRPFAHVLPASGTILVAGCGRGDLLAELATRGATVRGVEASAALVAECRTRGLAVEHASPAPYLESLAEGSLGAIVITRLGERYALAAWPRLVAAAWRALTSDGIVLCEGIRAGGPSARLRWLLARQRFAIVEAAEVRGADDGESEHVLVARKGQSG